MGFEFREKKELTLDIAGSIFKVKLNADFMQRVLKTGKKMKAYGTDPAVEADTKISLRLLATALTTF